jgi:hypothetical protein
MLRSNGRALCVLGLVVALVGLFAAPLLVHGQEYIQGNQCVVLVEEFCATWDPASGATTNIVKQVWIDYGPSKVSMIQYHFHQKGGYYDPFTIPENMQRLNYYNPYGIPAVVVDGGKPIEGYDNIKYYAVSDAVNNRLIKERAFDISISGNIPSGSVTVMVEQAASSTYNNATLRYALVESNCYYNASTASDNTYQHVARFIPKEDNITLPLTQTVSFTKNFPLDPTWAWQNLSFVAYLQNNNTKDVLQSNLYGFDTVPEISPLFVIPMGGLFLAVFALSMRRRLMRK